MGHSWIHGTSMLGGAAYNMTSTQSVLMLCFERDTSCSFQRWGSDSQAFRALGLCDARASSCRAALDRCLCETALPDLLCFWCSVQDLCVMRRRPHYGGLLHAICFTTGTM